MRTKIFFFAMLASIAANATVKVTPLSTDYSTQKVTFKVEWTNAPTAPYNNRVWVWVDFCPITGTTPATSFSTATISSPTKTGGNGTITNVTTRGFFIEYAATNAGTTVTVTLSNAPAGKFNWCVYGSDYPPNAVINGSSYTLKGTPPFIVNGSSLGAGVKSYSGGCITSITDATGCPGLFPLPTITSFTANPTSICTGAAVLLTAAASGAASYSFDNGSSWQTTTTKTVYPTTSTNYTLRVRSSTGCTTTDSRTASVSVTQPSARDAARNSCGCASGLTVVGSYCRDLTADAARTYTCSSVVLEIKNTTNGNATWATANSSCTGIGWRLPTFNEMVCLRNDGILSITTC
ncbi:MAG: hypothetical protein LBB31_01535, partial [Prevotellaceae bacterium]|nr:hypothetical protein [Prevotellaceae bacterium]